MLKELKETMIKEIKEGLMRMTHQTDDTEYKDRHYLKKDPMEILVMKSIITKVKN